jgi:hypothetical protein
VNTLVKNLVELAEELSTVLSDPVKTKQAMVEILKMLIEKIEKD